MESGYGQQGKTYTAIGVPWGKLYKRDFLIQNKLQFNTELRRVQDNLFNMYAFSMLMKLSILMSHCTITDMSTCPIILKIQVKLC